MTGPPETPLSTDATSQPEPPDTPEPPDACLPEFAESAQTCIKGESFFASLISNYAIPHHVTGHKDVGLDYICEWVHGEAPTGVLFGVQVKTFTISKRRKVLPEGRKSHLNWLEEYRFSNPNLKIGPETLNYWRRLGLPFYLFVVARTQEKDKTPETLDLYYKRFTVVLTMGQSQDEDPFYKVNHGMRFVAFADDENRRKGFARDLYIDLMRWQYYKGSIAYINPRKLGLREFDEEDSAFNDLFNNYRKEVCATYAKTKKYLEEKCGGA